MTTMTEEAPSWPAIVTTLKLILHRFDIDLDYHKISQAQKLEYEDLEKILYHIFLLLDPSDTRRRFWSLYPARNKEESSRFIECAAQFINLKDPSIKKVSKGQLRICRGEPFRKILACLLKSAANAITSNELKRHQNNGFPENHLANSVQENQSQSYSTTFDHSNAEDNLYELNKTIENLNSLGEELDEIENNTATKWKELLTNLSEPSGPLIGSIDLNASNMREMQKRLMDRLETCNLRCKLAEGKIREIEVPSDPPSRLSDSSILKLNTPKRTSYLVREIRQILTLSPDKTNEIHQEKSISTILRDLKDYDDGMNSLIRVLDEKQEKADEVLLEDPEVMEKFRFFESLIPLVRFRKIEF